MNKEFKKRVGRIIAEKRKSKKMTQQQLADKLGIPISTLACYEAGIRGMDLDTFFFICDALNLRPNDVQKSLNG